MESFDNSKPFLYAGFVGETSGTQLQPNSLSDNLEQNSGQKEIADISFHSYSREKRAEKKFLGLKERSYIRSLMQEELCSTQFIDLVARRVEEKIGGILENLERNLRAQISVSMNQYLEIQRKEEEKYLNLNEINIKKALKEKVDQIVEVIQRFTSETRNPEVQTFLKTLEKIQSYLGEKEKLDVFILRGYLKVIQEQITNINQKAMLDLITPEVINSLSKTLGIITNIVSKIVEDTKQRYQRLEDLEVGYLQIKNDMMDQNALFIELNQSIQILDEELQSSKKNKASEMQQENDFENKLTEFQENIMKVVCETKVDLRQTQIDFENKVKMEMQTLVRDPEEQLMSKVSTLNRKVELLEQMGAKNEEKIVSIKNNAQQPLIIQKKYITLNSDRNEKEKNFNPIPKQTEKKLLNQIDKWEEEKAGKAEMEKSEEAKLRLEIKQFMMKAGKENEELLGIWADLKVIRTLVDLKEVTPAKIAEVILRRTTKEEHIAHHIENVGLKFLVENSQLHSYYGDKGNIKTIDQKIKEFLEVDLVNIVSSQTVTNAKFVKDIRNNESLVIAIMSSRNEVISQTLKDLINGKQINLRWKGSVVDAKVKLEKAMERLEIEAIKRRNKEWKMRKEVNIKPPDESINLK